MLPILHLNGYKIANPTVLARIPERRAASRCSRATAGDPLDRRRRRPRAGARRARRQRSTTRSTRSREIQRAARARTADDAERAALADDRAAARRRAGPARRWSTASRSRARGARTRCRSTDVRDTPEHLAQLEEWMRELPRRGAVRRRRHARSPSWPSSPPTGDRRMSANPHANGGSAARSRPARLPRLRRRRRDARHRRSSEATRVLGGLLRDVIARNPRQLPPLRPRRDRVEPPRRRLRRHEPSLGRRASCRPTITSRPTAASWRCCRSTSARAGSRVTC